ncbi:hypothetical protein QE152_g12453 [Popillia japonica]|uniref:Uncharacterized protein n=1 Tax=Popillia japonica TaxID=7064 RepID=A0AAW1LRR2_POPJA
MFVDNGSVNPIFTFITNKIGEGYYTLSDLQQTAMNVTFLEETTKKFKVLVGQRGRQGEIKETASLAGRRDKNCSHEKRPLPSVSEEDKERSKKQQVSPAGETKTAVKKKDLCRSFCMYLYLILSLDVGDFKLHTGMKFVYMQEVIEMCPRQPIPPLSLPQEFEDGEFIPILSMPAEFEDDEFVPRHCAIAQPHYSVMPAEFEDDEFSKMTSEIINSMVEAMEHARLNLRRDENVAPYLKPIIRWKPVPIETFKLFFPLAHSEENHQMEASSYRGIQAILTTRP